MPIKSSSPAAWFRPPTWLEELKNLDSLPLRRLLKHSLYYPASGNDGDPVRLLGGYIHSFVHAEYVMNKSEILEYVEGRRNGFRGYRLSMLREVKSSELVPDGWQPSRPLITDGNPAAYRSLMPEPFALWAIYERLPDFDHFHGPLRFSLLHICGDGVATYEALYNAQEIQPDVLAIIRPGTGFGLNWTDFRDDQKILARIAFQNRGGKPRYLLQESQDKGCYWQGYDTRVEQWSGSQGQYSLYACADPYPVQDEIGECYGIAEDEIYTGFAGIDRHRYETFKRARDEAKIQKGQQ